MTEPKPSAAKTRGLWPVAAAARPSSARFWAMVASFGALWGGIEITLGSFLHTMRLPMGGTMLAVLAVALLVAQRQLMPVRGLSLATGLVAAICKSVSPGGVILGPMVGITSEALLVEVALLAAPRSVSCAALAGALTVCWAMFQGVISHYVYYGGTVVELYVAMLERAAQVVGLTPSQGWQLVGLVVILIALVGVSAALAGRGLGRELARELVAEQGQGG